jgi:pyruvate dehydrogenase E2 component (dihydrolipoamide acetyltransferase)
MTAVDQSLAGVTTPLKGIRRTAARRMVAAWVAPVFHLSVEVDMTAALAAKSKTVGATVTDVLVACCAAALAEHSALNAHYADEAITVFEPVNIGIAVATDAGLVVPVIQNVDQLDVAGIANARREVVDKARQGKLGMADVSGGTFTVSNLGMFGIDYFDAILNVPQVAILAVGGTRQRQIWNDGDPVWRPMSELSLTCDHRAIDGATGARFLSTLQQQLESAS